MKNGHRGSMMVSPVVALLVLGGATACQGMVLASYQVEVSVDPQFTPFYEQGGFTLFYAPYEGPWNLVPGSGYWPECGPLMDFPFTAADVGMTYTVDSGPAFDVAAECLTNGVLDAGSYYFERMGMGGAETMFWWEDFQWQNGELDWIRIDCYCAGSNGIDLQGFEVQSISFHLGAYEPYHVMFTIEVNGSPAVTAVGLDIKPGSSPNAVNINGNGVIPVAILGSADLDVSQVDVGTLSFAGLELRIKPSGIPQCSIQDVSGPTGVPDGCVDLVCQFVDDPARWLPGDGTATLTGNLTDGTPIAGTDQITVVP